MENPKEAFEWIVDVLNKNNIPFQITGGLAAIFYGSKRPLYDIDIEIPTDRFSDIVKDVEQYIVYGPAKYVDDNWDLYMLTLNFKGQPIDLGSAEVYVRSGKKEPWVLDVTDFSHSTHGEVFGLRVPIVPKEALIRYKNILNRDTDREDIKAIA